MLNKRQTSFPKSPVSLAICSSHRVHSAPPTSRKGITLRGGARLPPIIRSSVERPPDFYMDKPSTPDPDQVHRILEQRIAQAIAGPSTLLKKQQTSSEDQNSANCVGRRGSLIRSAAIGSDEMHLVPVDDDEMAMLRSINKSQYSKGSMGGVTLDFSFESLHKHEYEDKSSDEDVELTELTVGEQLKTRRKLSMVRQEEQEESRSSVDGMTVASIRNRSASGIRNLENRLTGMRHEKMRSSTKSGEMGDDQISGLVYDKEFDCYYNPKTDRYYRLKSQSKSGDGLMILQPKEV